MHCVIDPPSIGLINGFAAFGINYPTVEPTFSFAPFQYHLLRLLNCRRTCEARPTFAGTWYSRCRALVLVRKGGCTSSAATVCTNCYSVPYRFGLAQPPCGCTGSAIRRKRDGAPSFYSFTTGASRSGHPTATWNWRAALNTLTAYRILPLRTTALCLYQCWARQSHHRQYCIKN